MSETLDGQTRPININAGFEGYSDPSYYEESGEGEQNYI